MPRLPGVNHLQAVAAFERAGFHVLRQGRHVIMTDGFNRVVIPRNNPINAFTMAGVVHQSGLTIEEFKKLL